jgi:hypothetical protein
MNLREVIAKEDAVDIPQMFADFLPIAMEVLNIDKLPKIKLKKFIEDEEQPTFGRYINDLLVIELGIGNRHPVDILRTLAHELVHFKQDQAGKLGIHSGNTGSPEENQANEVAGIIMRHFNMKHSRYLSTKPLIFNDITENFADGKNPGRKGLAKRSGVNCKQPVSKLRSIAKNSSGEKQRMAHWCANMKSGRKK